MSKVVRHTMIRLDGVFGHELSRTTEQFQWSEGMISQGNLHIDGQSRFMIFKPDISPGKERVAHLPMRSLNSRNSPSQPSNNGKDGSNTIPGYQ
eukprot:scaffold48028_cov17-Tisochrysis_lutea.AAC.1